jgi:transposase InsO family protein
VVHLQRRFRVSQRRACRLVGQVRSTQRYAAVPGDFESRLVAAMGKHAQAHPRFGYRRVHALLVSDGWVVNRKRVERLWGLHQMAVPPRRAKASGAKAFGDSANSAWALPAVRPGHVWSYDFVAVRAANGAPLRVLNVVDEFTRECVGFHVAPSIGAADVVKVLDRLFAQHGRPAMLRSDNGREFIADTVVNHLAGLGVRAVFIAKASPQQNCYVERFNGSMRDELLHGEQLHTLTEARVVIGAWIAEYNTVRPHRGLGMMTPAAYAAKARSAIKASDESPSEGGG